MGPDLCNVGVLVSDDATGVGIADDIAIPVVMAAALTYGLQKGLTSLTHCLDLMGKYMQDTRGF